MCATWCKRAECGVSNNWFCSRRLFDAERLDVGDAGGGDEGGRTRTAVEVSVYDSGGREGGQAASSGVLSHEAADVEMVLVVFRSVE